MLGAIKYHFRHLADFSGRDARQTFWYWFLFLFIANIGVSIIATVPMMIEAMTVGLEAARSGNEAAAEAMIMDRMAGRVESVVAVSLALGAANLLLMAASFTRRVHDSGKPGIWAAVTGVLYLASLVWSWMSAGEAAEMMRQVAAARNPTTALEMQGQMAWQGLFGYLPLIMLLVFGILKSNPGPNKYGAEPVRF
ncbi:DUF805 domain-containing protein [Tsuneonella sp. HG249]